MFRNNTFPILHFGSYEQKCPDSIFFNEFIIYLARYNELNQDLRLNTISRESARIELNSIRKSTLTLIDNLTPYDIDYDLVKDKLKTNKNYDKIIHVGYIPGYQGGHWGLYIDILPLFFSGQKLHAQELNRISSAVNLSESILNIPLTNFKLFKNGDILKADHLNSFVEPIENLNIEIDCEARWKFFPLKDGENLYPKILNELITELNKVVLFIATQKKGEVQDETHQ